MGDFFGGPPKINLDTYNNDRDGHTLEVRQSCDPLINHYLEQITNLPGGAPVDLGLRKAKNIRVSNLLKSRYFHQ